MPTPPPLPNFHEVTFNGRHFENMPSQLRDMVAALPPLQPPRRAQPQVVTLQSPPAPHNLAARLAELSRPDAPQLQPPRRTRAPRQVLTQPVNADDVFHHSYSPSASANTSSDSTGSSTIYRATGR